MTYKWRSTLVLVGVHVVDLKWLLVKLVFIHETTSWRFFFLINVDVLECFFHFTHFYLVENIIVKGRNS
jgi:hypothetical protein